MGKLKDWRLFVLMAFLSINVATGVLNHIGNWTSISKCNEFKAQTAMHHLGGAGGRKKNLKAKNRMYHLGK